MVVVKMVTFDLVPAYVLIPPNKPKPRNFSVLPGTESLPETDYKPRLFQHVANV